ncbi:MAG: hypothetical protein K2X11_20985, partial [Acetobacteraceae bacterium]|nr:hypothetical protein [Acetobacteraceae bacterium]
MSLRRRSLGLLLPLAACATDDRRTERGIGGTGGIADRGIGGTGAVAARGIGGTGVIATGIIGTITAFGSIWANGRRVEVGAAAISLDGEPATEAMLRVGGVVALLARPDTAGTLVADAVELRVAVAGPVDRVEPGGTFTILGQRVAPDGTRRGDVTPAPGVWLAVSGLRRPDGVIVASRIGPWPERRGWLLRGPRSTIEGAISGDLVRL